MEWVDEPKEPLNLDIGNLYYHVEFYEWKQQLRRQRLFVAAFNRAMEQYFNQQDIPKLPGKAIKIIINERTYWYITALSRHGGIAWTPMFLPEEPVKEIVL
jgi:hypothetical protein